MKSKFLLLLIVLTIKSFCQDSLRVEISHTQIFSLAPISKRVRKVNGLVFGVGHIENKNIKNQTINGLNAELNPAPIAATFMAFLSVVYLPEIIKNNAKCKDSLKQHDFKIKNWQVTPNLMLNGINLSTGCFFTTTSMNGLNVSLGNKFQNFNGISIAPLGTISDHFNGLSIGMANANNNLNGLGIGFYNQSYQLKGLQFGIFNQTENNLGIQIGIYNRSYTRGLQLGFWNKNKKCALPFLNW